MTAASKCDCVHDWNLHGVDGNSAEAGLRPVLRPD